MSDYPRTAEQPRDTTQKPAQESEQPENEPDRDADVFFKLTSFRLPSTGSGVSSS